MSDAELINKLREELAQVTGERDELLADRSIKHNGARMLARFVLSQLPDDPMSHDDSELYHCAKGFLNSDVPTTTKWLLQMMEVARRDTKELPQQLFQAQAENGRLKAVLSKGGLWSFFRLVLSQGGDIQLDYNAGKYKCYEEYSARLDAAARERVEQFQAQAALDTREAT